MLIGEVDKTMAPWYQPELEQAGTHFFCETCLGHKPLDDRSTDPRYCHGCCDLLMAEAAMQPTRRVDWMPKISALKSSKVHYPVAINMHTINGENIRSVHNSPAARPEKPVSKRGPKHRDLPEDLIREWASLGMGSKAIAARLKREQSITVHYSTIQRILNGQRVMI